ncbi:MAG TPA: polysaccharide deacetylase family protein [Methylomirabilota bacterium]|nr:polysaccharide deacetylase family protein [Methylomirabilota bacterium]
MSAIERFTPNIIYRVRTHRPVVALSFDDGPHPTFTLEVLAKLEILHRHDAKATFFLIGERTVRHPEVVSQIKLRDTRLAITTSETDLLWATPIPTSLIT